MSDLSRLEGEVAVVMGAPGRLGPIWTETLLRAGAKVFTMDHPGALMAESFEAIMIGLREI